MSGFSIPDEHDTADNAGAETQVHAKQPSLYPPSTPHLNPHGLRILTDPSSGRGVYASHPLSSGTTIEISPVLLFCKEEWESHGSKTILDCYTFKWGRMGQMALALGLGSLFNHSARPSVGFYIDKETHSIRYSLTRDVGAGEELCISYGPWGKQYESSADPSAGDQDAGDESDYESRKEKELAGLLNIGQGRSDSEESDDEDDNRGEGCSKSASTQHRSSVHGSRLRTATSMNGSHDTTDQPFSSSRSSPIPVEYAETPIWRLTSLPDPTMVKLRHIECHAIILPARSSSRVLSFLKARCSDLGRGRSLAGEEDPIRHARTLTPNTTSTDNPQQKTLKALLCPIDNIEESGLKELLIQDGILDSDATLIRVQVPDSPAPMKARLAEWCASWPVTLRGSSSSTGSVNASNSSSGNASPLPTSSPSTPAATALSSALALASAPPKPSSFADRRADALFWTPTRTQWVVSKLARCVLLAEQAKASGQIPVGVHVCPSILPLDTTSTASEPDSATVAGCWDRHGIPLEGGEAIEADAYDTRIAQRNPIKHAVGNAVKKVAEMRAVKRQAEASAAIANSDSPPPSSLLLNGQDYLLTSLTLFTTHEPCVYCCMSLVHSRVRTLIFLQPSPGSGGCCGSELPPNQRCDSGIETGDEKDGIVGGPYALQEQKNLNHRFEVWKWRGGLDIIQREVNRMKHNGEGDVDVAKLLDLRSCGVADP